jgi:phosphoglycerol transferase MdoB-like AlkP superfamily enzyme
MNYKEFIQSLFKIFLVYLIGLLIFQYYRTSIMLAFGNSSELKPLASDVVKAYWLGFVYDTVVLTYGFSLLFVVTLAGLLVPERYHWFETFYKGFARWYIYIVLFVFLWILIADYYFYKFFQTHFSILAFGIKDDDTHAVLRSVWTDYHVVRIILGVVVFFAAFVWLLKKIAKTTFHLPFPKKLWSQIAFVVIIAALYGLGMRGSVGVFPIGKDDVVVSSNTFINSLTMNGVFALKEAFADRASCEIDTNSQKTLQQYGFNNANEVISEYLHRPVSDNGNLYDNLIDTTAKSDFLEKNPPHVVFVMMESMSNYYLDLHSKDLNLLGTLESQLPECIVFRNFLPCRNGTIHSLEGLMVNTPLTPISQSTYMDKSLQSSVAWPFFNKNYETNFITGAKLGWRNMDKYVFHQYFKVAEGCATIEKEVPGAKTNTWGAYDEFMFDRMYQKLEHANGKPQFIFGFSTTNHTPYELPAEYKPFPIHIPDSLSKDLRCNIDIARKNLTAYQYANDCIGRFIQKIRNSPMGKNTIVVVTGDHNTKALFDFTDNHMLQKLGVPMIMYIPKAYRPDIYNNSRFGSHKDIFPTIFNLALSQAPYFKSGNNLFANIPEDMFYAVNDNSTVMNKRGCVLNDGKPLYFLWKGKNGLVATNLKESPWLNDLNREGKASSAALTLFVQKELKKKNAPRQK